jgi:hypothetical protein
MTVGWSCGNEAADGPQDVSSPADLRSALESFQDMDIKILTDVPADATEGELEAEVKEGPDETAEPAPAVDSIGESGGINISEVYASGL